MQRSTQLIATKLAQFGYILPLHASETPRCHNRNWRHLRGGSWRGIAVERATFGAIWGKVVRHIRHERVFVSLCGAVAR